MGNLQLIQGTLRDVQATVEEQLPNRGWGNTIDNKVGLAQGPGGKQKESTLECGK